jgi:hypothetical protein
MVAEKISVSCSTVTLGTKFPTYSVLLPLLYAGPRVGPFGPHGP